MFVNNKLRNFGTRSYEEQVALGSMGDYGEVNHVVVDSTTESSFNPADHTDDRKIKFKIEKYIRIIEKKLPEGKELPEPFKKVNRDSTLQGVINLDHFQKFIDNNKEEYGEYYLSDLFGDSERMLELEFSDVFKTISRLLVAEGNLEDLQTLGRGVNINDATGNVMDSFNQEQKEYMKIIDKYMIELTEIQEQAIIDGQLIEDESYGNVSIPLDLVNDPSFMAAYIAESGGFSSQGEMQQGTDGSLSGLANAKSTLRGSVGVKYGIRIVANLPPGCGIPVPSLDTVTKAKSALEKCFYMNFIDDGQFVTDNYEKRFALPVVTAEIDVIDHKISDFNYKIVGGEAEYPMDVDCLLRKIVESAEYKLIFEHILNPKSVTSMTTILSAISFDSAIGYKDGWEAVKEMEDEDGETTDNTVDVDQDAWDGKDFEDTRLLVRKIFSGFYLSDDFESPDAEVFDFGAIIQAAFGSLTGWLKKQGAQVNFWWRRNYQPNPFDANGEECKSEYEKLLE
jgi:hypothetical protein